MRQDFQKLKILIDSLTLDEDLRQELWISALSDEYFFKNFNRILTNHLHNRSILDFQSKLFNFIKAPLSPEAEYAISILSIFEQQVLYQLLLGRTPLQIAEYKDIDVVRINQAILSIKNSLAWKKMKRRA